MVSWTQVRPPHLTDIIAMARRIWRVNTKQSLLATSTATNGGSRGKGRRAAPATAATVQPAWAYVVETTADLEEAFDSSATRRAVLSSVAELLGRFGHPVPGALLWVPPPGALMMLTVLCGMEAHHAASSQQCSRSVFCGMTIPLDASPTQRCVTHVGPCF